LDSLATSYYDSIQRFQLNGKPSGKRFSQIENCPSFIHNLRPSYTMEEVFRKAVAHNEASRKTSVHWRPDQPHQQPYYTYDKTKKSWEPREAGEKRVKTSTIGRLALYAWNIDFMLPYANSRMEIGLRTLGELVSQVPTDTGVVIFLQECVDPDLETIANTPWIQERFVLTDLTSDNWASGHYGTTTLVDRRLLPLDALFRVHYLRTRMERDALFVDFTMRGGKKVRLANSHLESLDQMPAMRPHQVEIIGECLHEDGIDAGIAAGDFNAIQDFDRTLHSDNGLKDAYLELGGQEDSDEGYTWGQQAATSLRERYGCSRMDKVFFRGALELKSFERFGKDVLLEDPEEIEDIVDLGFDKPWITDHMGIKAVFDIGKS
jgi:tyrosyl-DNA phosphodiesterase 2